MNPLIAAAALAAMTFVCSSTPLRAANTVTSVTSATTEFSPGFPGELEKVAAAHHGTLGVYCQKLGTSETIAINADEPFETASTIKTAVMCTAFDLLDKGNGPFKSYYDTKVYDGSTSAGGSGLLQNYKVGKKMELKEMLHLMITVSDNSATNMLCEWMGLDAINGWLDAHGFKQTRIFSTIGGKIVADQKMREEWGLGRTTPREMGQLFTMIATGKAGTPASTDEMLRILSHQYFDGQIAAGLPPMVWVGSKSGAVNSSRSDCAIINGPSGVYVLIVYTKNNADKSWDNDNEAQVAIKKISTMVWNHFNPGSHFTPTPGTEKF